MLRVRHRAHAHASHRGVQSRNFTPILPASALPGGLRRCGACQSLSYWLRTGPDAQAQDFAGGDYACMHFHGTGTEIGAAWAGMAAPGRIPAGWTLAARPAIEIYGEDFAMDTATGAFPCWLYLAVQRRL